MTLAGPERSVFLTRRDFAEGRPDVIAALVRALQQAGDWVAANPREAAHLTEEALGGSADVWEIALACLPWRLESVGARLVAEQQEAADILYAEDVLKRPIEMSEAVIPGLEPVVAAALGKSGHREQTTWTGLATGAVKTQLTKAAV